MKRINVQLGKKSFLVIAISLALAVIMALMSMPQTVQVFASSIKEITTASSNTIVDSDEDSYSSKDYSEDEYDKTEIIAEVNSERTETSKTFVQADGTYIMQDYGSPVHYLKENEFFEIDNTLDNNFQTTANEVTVSFDKGDREYLVFIMTSRVFRA